MDISKYFRESSFEFEITRVDCTYKNCKRGTALAHSIAVLRKGGGGDPRVVVRRRLRRVREVGALLPESYARLT